MLDVVLDDDVETVAPTGAARSADAKAAIKYLELSGATAICLIETGTGCAIQLGHTTDPRVVAIYWLPAAQAKPLVRRARKHAGRHPDSAAASAALAQAASDHRATLTPHVTAMTRAGAAAERLDAYVASLRSRGAMKEFTRTYRERRMAAAERGEGFMSYKNAELRLRRALIPMLLNGVPPAMGQSFFAEIFRR
jgi:hypothetical protein